MVAWVGRVRERVKRFYETELRGGRPIGRSSIGTCTKLTRSLNMDERHQQARQLYMGHRHEKAHDRQMLRDAVSCRLQAYFITLRQRSLKTPTLFYSA
jgi:hypothetical protein